MLTVVLWAAGGISTPFIGFYVFHLALIGILGGPGATLASRSIPVPFSLMQRGS